MEWYEGCRNGIYRFDPNDHLIAFHTSNIASEKVESYCFFGLLVRNLLPVFFTFVSLP